MTTATDRGAAISAGLRELADLIDANADLAEAFGYAPPTRLLLFASTADEYRRLADVLGGDRIKTATDKWAEVTRSFGPAVDVRVFADRSEVCTARVVGTETVEVPDPNAPKITVERDIVEWDCTPILATGDVA